MPPTIPQVSQLDTIRQQTRARLVELGLRPAEPEIGAIENFANAFRQSLFTDTRVGFNELTGDVRESERIQRRADRNIPTREGTSQFLGSIAGSLIPSAAAIGLTATGVGAAIPITAAAVLQGGTAAGQSIKDIREHEKRTGEDISTADTVATAALNGVIVGVFSRFGLGRISQGVGAVSKEISKLSVQKAIGAITQQQFRRAMAGKLAKVIPGSSAIEAVEEAAEQVGQNAIDQVFGTRTRALLEGVPQAALAGAIGGAVLGPVGVGASIPSATKQGQDQVQAQKEAEKQQAEDIKELDALADQKVKDQTPAMQVSAVLNADEQIALREEAQEARERIPIPGERGVPEIGVTEIQAVAPEPIVAEDAIAIEPSIGIIEDATVEPAIEPDIVTASPPSPEQRTVPTQEDAVPSTAPVASEVAVEGDTGVEIAPEAPVSPQITQEASEVVSDPEAQGTLFEGPDGITLQATVIPGLDLAVAAIETGARFTVQHTRSAGQWLFQQGVDAYSSFKAATASLIQQFGEGVKRHVGRIMGAVKQLAKDAQRNQQGAVGDVAKARQQSAKIAQKAARERVKPGPDVIVGIKSDERLIPTESERHNQPPLNIGADPSERGPVRNIWNSIKDTAGRTSIEWLNPKSAVTVVSQSPAVRDAMYTNLKSAETNRNGLNQSLNESYEQGLAGQGMNEGSAKRIAMSTNAAGMNSALSGLIGRTPGRTKADVRGISTTAGNVDLTPAEISNIAAIVSNQKARASFLRAGFVIDRFKTDSSLRKTAYRTLKMTPDQLTEMEASMTEDERFAAAESLRHMNETLKPDMIEKAQSDGDLNLVETINEIGVYFPIMRDFALAKSPSEQAKATERESQTLDPTSGSLGMAANMDKAGFLQERSLKTTAPMRIGDVFNITRNHSRRAATWITMDDALKTARQTLQLKKADLTRKFGKQGVEYFDDLYVSVVEEVLGSTQNRLTMSEGVARSLSRKLTVGILGLNPVTTLKQTASWATAATELGVQNMAAGTRSATDSSLDEEMIANSPNLADRRGGDQFRLHNVPEGTEQAELQANFEQKVMAPLKFADWMVMRNIWASAKIEYQQQNPDQPIDLQAVAQRVDQIVSDTQPSFSVLDISRLQRRARKNPLLKILLMFTNQRFQNLNIMARTAVKLKRGEISASEAAKTTALMGAVTPLMLLASEELIRQIVGTGADDAEEFRKRLSRSIVDTNIGNVPLLSPFVQFYRDKLNNTFADSRFSRNPAEGFAEDLLAGLAKITNDVDTDNFQGVKEIGKNMARVLGAPTKPFDLVSQLLENRF